jgi:hypothetical protein
VHAASTGARLGPPPRSADPRQGWQHARTGRAVGRARERAERRGSAARPSSRHIQSSIAPAAKTPPSIAYSIRSPIRHATVGSRPPAGRGTSSPTWPRMKTPVP